MAEWPERIKSIFKTKEVNAAGCYVVTLYLTGEPIDVVLDDLIPCFDHNQKPCFTKTNGNEIWVPLLEKAYAKLNGSYDNIIAGICSQSLSALTGAPC